MRRWIGKIIDRGKWIMQYGLESSSVQLVAKTELNTITGKATQTEKEYLPKTRSQQEARKQKRPSLKTWHLVLMGGDGLL